MNTPHIKAWKCEQADSEDDEPITAGLAGQIGREFR